MPDQPTNPAAVLSFRVCAGIGLVLVVGVIVAAVAIDFGPARELWMLRMTGYTALGALFMSLLSSPVGRVVRRMRSVRSTPQVSAFRRSLGILAACCALGHASIALTMDRYAHLFPKANDGFDDLDAAHEALINAT